MDGDYCLMGTEFQWDEEKVPEMDGINVCTTT